MLHAARHMPVLLLALALLTSCSAPPVIEESLDTAPGNTRLDGTIINIVEVKEDSLGGEIGGALVGGALGSLVGGGTGKSIAIGVGSVAGSAVGGKALGDTVHRLTLREDKTGLTFDAIVHSNGFLMNDKVAFTVDKGRVTSIMHESLLRAREDGGS
jgi:outer membrane lipoprotein SlyB